MRSMIRVFQWCFVINIILHLACQANEDFTPENRPLSVLLPRAIQEIDPRLTGDAYGHKVSRLIFSSLITIDPFSLKPIPDLAQSIEVVSPTQYRVNLRPGLRFSDGSGLDSQDVLATYRSIVSPEIGSRYSRTYQRIEAIETPDLTTIIFHLREPHATFLTDLEMPILRSEDEHTVLGFRGGPLPIGAGPYQLISASEGRLELEKNQYWYRGEPLFPHIQMTVIQDDNTRALRMLAGAADLCLNTIPPLLIPLFSDRRRFKIATSPGIGTTYIGINLQAPPLSDIRVRRAIAHAIDRNRIINTKFGGRAQLAQSWITPGHWAFDDQVTIYPYDLSRSQALLDSAGYKKEGDHPRFSLTLHVGNDRFRQSIARIIAAMLWDAGIDITIRSTETATLIDDLNKGHFQLTILQIPEVIEPHLLSWFFASDRIPEAGKGKGANRWRIRNHRLDEVLEVGRKNHQLEIRIRAYREAQKILANQLPVIPLWHEDNVAVMNQRSSSFRVPRDGRFSTLARQ